MAPTVPVAWSRGDLVADVVARRELFHRVVEEWLLELRPR